MPATWPDTLPQYLLLDGNREAMGDGRLRTQTDTGPGKVRRRSSAVSKPLSGNMIMTEAQLETLLTFVSTDLVGGSLPFTMPTSRGSDTWLVRFADALPAYVHLGGGNWSVALALEILPS